MGSMLGVSGDTGVAVGAGVWVGWSGFQLDLGVSWFKST